MTPDETRAAAQRVPDPGAEQEVDFGRYGRAVAERWWLLALGIVAGAVIGALVTLGSSSSYKATAQVYLGDPLAPGGGSVGSLATTLSLASNLVVSQSVVRDVAAKVGLKPGRLSGNIATKSISGFTGAKVGIPTPLLAITVTGSPPAKIAAAANALATVVVNQIAPYESAKIQTLKDRLVYDTAQLTAVNDRLAVARTTQQQILSSKIISPTDKLVSLANLNSVITQALAQQIGLEQDRFGTRQDLSLAQNIESGRIVSVASASRSPAPGRRSAIVIGAFIGLLIGIFAALVWEPLATRRPATQ